MARRRKGKDEQKGRLNLLIDPTLKNWVHGFADKKGTSVSAIVVMHFMELRDEDNRPKIKQI
jgi:hypothetical protein